MSGSAADRKGHNDEPNLLSHDDRGGRRQNAQRETEPRPRADCFQNIWVRAGGDPEIGEGVAQGREQAIEAGLRRHSEDKPRKQSAQIAAGRQNQQPSGAAARQHHAGAEDQAADHRYSGERSGEQKRHATPEAVGERGALGRLEGRAAHGALRLELGSDQRQTAGDGEGEGQGPHEPWVTIHWSRGRAVRRGRSERRGSLR